MGGLERLALPGRAWVAAAMALALSFWPPAQAAGRSVVIGTGPVAGTYFPAGGAVCTLVNRAQGGGAPRCLVESTGGSADNLERLARGEIDFAVVQSDWQFLAVRGGGVAGKPMPDLRAVFSLHAQPITVVVGPDAGIGVLEDIKGRRVNLGPPGSGARAAGEALIGALGWGRDDFEDISALDSGAVAGALCAGCCVVLLP